MAERSVTGSDGLMDARDAMRESLSAAPKRDLQWMLMTHAIMAAQVTLIFVVLLVPQDFLKLHSHYVYLIHYLLFLPFFFTARDRCAFLFSPSFLIISYVCASFIIGGFAFSHGFVLARRDIMDFCRWSHFSGPTAYFMICNLCAALAYFLARTRSAGSHSNRTGGSLRSYAPQLIAGGILFGAFSFVRIGLGFLGGNGNFAVYPRLFGALVICIALAKSRWRYRIVIYAGLLLLFAATQYSNRRVILLLGLSVIFLEAAHLQDLRLSLRRVLTCVVILVLAMVLQVTMTIARGTAGFKGSYWQTFASIEKFVGLDNVIAYSLKQTEGPTTFFHSNNALNYVLDDPSLLCYGSTLAKVLFIVVPRSVWANKPKSMVDIYTTRWDPAWRQMGCSTGINVYAEYFWNFHVFGVLCTILIFYLLNRAFFFYLSALRTGNIWSFVFLAAGYSSVLMYARGHGLYNLAMEVGLAFGVQVILFNSLVSVLTGTKCPRIPCEGLSLQEPCQTN